MPPIPLDVHFAATEARFRRVGACWEAQLLDPQAALSTGLVLHWLPQQEPVTVFHSARIPGCSLSSFARALCRPDTCCDATTAAMAAVLMLRFERATGYPVSALMMHRLLLACMLVAAKTHQDSFPNNANLAQAAGVQLCELNRLETALVAALDWRTVVSVADCDELAALCAAPSSAPQPPMRPPAAMSMPVGLPSVMKRVDSSIDVSDDADDTYAPCGPRHMEVSRASDGATECH